MNDGKTETIRRLVRRHRQGAPLVAREQWRLLFETGDLDRRADTKLPRLQGNEHERRLGAAAVLKNVVGSAGRVQMLRYQVVGQLRAWLSNRSNEYRDVVERSSLSDDIRRQLHSINQQEAWFSRFPVRVHGSDSPIPPDIRRLARQTMKHVMGRHRRPRWQGMPVNLDRREALWLKEASHATQQGRVTHWLRISSPGVGRISVPLTATKTFLRRGGRICGTIQISEKEGKISFGIVTDVSEPFARSRQAYQPRCEEMGLDYGLTCLFASDSGDLMGRGFLANLRKMDHHLETIRRHAARSGQSPRTSRRYRAGVERVRGYLRTEIHRVLNSFVKTRAPERIILEDLDFRHPSLSPQMNRILSNCGRSVVRNKLQDLSDRHGISVHHIDPAYTSQECSSCGHVHHSNRNGSSFRCRRCGLKIHADVNAARNIAKRRSLAPVVIEQIRDGDDPTRLRGRRRTLERLRQTFERKHGPYGHVRSGGSDPAAYSRAGAPRFAWDEVTCGPKVRINRR